MATVKELREEAKRLGLTGYSRMNKAQLEKAVRNAQAQAQEQAHVEAAQAIINSNPAEWSITAIVQEQISTDIAHINFIRSVKNGHVPQSVLAELSPEEYAQVMQEVADMEKKEQEQERAQQAQPAQATPAVVEYDPEFVENCYSPDYQACPAVLDDVPEPRDQAQDVQTSAPVRKHKHSNSNYGTVHAMTNRELRETAKRLGIKDCAKMDRLQLEELVSKQTTRFPRRAYDFSLCIDEKKLRRELSHLDADGVEAIARNLKGKTIALPINSKLITKKFLIDAIARAYFPNTQTAPASTPKPVRVAKHVFISGRHYWKYSPFNDFDITTIQVITILERKGDYLTIREEDTGFISRKKIRIDRCDDEYIKLNNYEYDVVYSTSNLEPVPVPITSPKFPRLFKNVQRALIREAITIASYMQPKPQPLALPAVVEHQDQPAAAEIPAPIIEQAQPQPKIEANPNPELFRKINQTFKPGVTYFFSWMDGERSPCEIISRTQSTAIILASGDKKEHRVKIHRNFGDENAEYLYPQGKYSMCPICLASDPVSISTFTVGQLYGAVEQDAHDKITVAECIRVDGNRVFFQIHFRDGRGPVTDSNAVVDLTAGTERTYLTILGLGHLAADHTVPVPEWCTPRLGNHQPSAPVQEIRHEAWQDYICDHCDHAPTWTHEQFTTGILLARKNTPAPATRKPRRSKSIDTSRQILICFDYSVPNEGISIDVQPAKPAPRRKRKPRIKRDYSRQLVFIFDEVTDSKTNQREAA